MSRLLRIALREYLSYVRTVGFWLSLALLPVILSAAVGIPIMMERSSPTPRLAIVDLTGERLAPAVAQALAEGGRPERIAGQCGLPPPAAAAAAIEPPPQAGQVLRRAMVKARAARRIDAAAGDQRQGRPGSPSTSWTLNPNDNVLQALLRDRMGEVVRRQQLDRRRRRAERSSPRRTASSLW